MLIYFGYPQAHEDDAVAAYPIARIATNAICHGFQVGKAYPITRRTGTGVAAVTAGISGMSSCNSSSIA